jgi:hypothetical protein
VGAPGLHGGDLLHIDPGLARDPDFVDWYVTFFRLAASPGSAAAFYRMMMDTDVADVLPAIRVPTLVCFREDYSGPSQFVADQIPGAPALAVEGVGYLPAAPESMFDQLERFLLAVAEERRTDRVLATVLFTDVCGSTELAARLGDHAWGRPHEAPSRDRPRRARALRRAQGGYGGRRFPGDVRRTGPRDPLRVCRTRRVATDRNRRAGVHTGECEVVGGKVAGLAVNMGPA